MDEKQKASNPMSTALTSAGVTGAIGLGQSLVGSIFDALFGSWSQKQQARLEKDIMKYQYDLYSPSNQVKRLRQAGLNPGLMYSGNGMQSGGATGSIGLTSTHTDGGNINPMLLTEIETAKSVQNLNRANADKASASAAYDREQAISEPIKRAGIELDNAQKQLENYIKSNSAESIINEARQRVKNAQAEYDRIVQETATSKAQERNYNVYSDDNEQTRTLRKRVFAADEALKRANAEERYSQSDLNVALRTLYEIQQTGARIENYTGYINAVSKQFELAYMKEHGAKVPTDGKDKVISRLFELWAGTEKYFEEHASTKPFAERLAHLREDFMQEISKYNLPYQFAMFVWDKFSEMVSSSEFTMPSNW